jgi:hypothetical protein
MYVREIRLDWDGMRDVYGSWSLGVPAHVYKTPAFYSIFNIYLYNNG